MPKYAQIANSGVLSVIESETKPDGDWREVLADAPPTPSDTEEVVETGWVLTDNAVQRIFSLVPKPSGEPVRVAPSVTHVERWQLRLELDIRGHLSAIQTALQALPAAQRRAALARLEHKPRFVLREAFTEQIRTALNLTRPQIAEIFEAAALHQ